MEGISFFISFFWALWFTGLLWLAQKERRKRREPYRWAGYAALSDREGQEETLTDLDSRGLRRAMDCLEAGARLINLQKDDWQKLDRRLELMGLPEDSRRYLTEKLIRCAAGALPALTLPVLLDRGWTVFCYPIFTAVLFRRQLTALDRRYRQWQQLLIREVPEVVDRLRICFAGGRDYLSSLEEAAAGAGQAMGQALKGLTEDIRTRGSRAALASFSASFDLPAINRLASALSLAVESGYEEAEVYLINIGEELRTLRQEAAEALIKGRPEKVKQLYLILFALAVGSLLLKGWEIVKQIGGLFA